MSVVVSVNYSHVRALRDSHVKRSVTDLARSELKRIGQPLSPLSPLNKTFKSVQGPLSPLSPPSPLSPLSPLGPLSPLSLDSEEMRAPPDEQLRDA